MFWTCFGHVSDMFWTCFRHILDMFWTCFGHVWDMLSTCVGHVLDMFWTCFGHVLDMCWTCFGHVLDMFGTSVGHLWDIFGTSHCTLYAQSQGVWGRHAPALQGFGAPPNFVPKLKVVCSGVFRAPTKEKLSYFWEQLDGSSMGRYWNIYSYMQLPYFIMGAFWECAIDVGPGVGSEGLSVE